MLPPEYLRDLPERILALYDGAEESILRDMARRIAAYDYWISAADHQAERLLEAGRTQEEILRTLSGLTGRTQEELKRMMQEAGARSLRSDAVIYRNAGLSVPDRPSEPLRKLLNAGYRATLGEMKNLCRTTARTATKQFEDALDLAWLQVQSGAFDVNTAIRNAIDGLAEHGISAIRYSGGRTDSIEVAVRRAAVTGVNQTCCRMQEELADEVGCDLVEVSAHAGARPSHALWQGKIYSRSGTSDKYPDFRTATGYGTGAGLGGWNCRHGFSPWVEGAPRVYSDEALAEMEAPKYEYNGRQLTEYEAEQQQRAYEREIRRRKREYVALDAAGLDTSEAAVKLRTARERQADFLRKTGLKQQGDRELSAGFGRREAAMANSVIAHIEKEANRLFTLGSTSANVSMYLQEKTLIDKLHSNGVKYIQRINSDEIIVEAGKPRIVAIRQHARDNLERKSDRAEMTTERAQTFVDEAKLVLYQIPRETLKFLSQEGYTVLNLQHELVTSVPQKWRKKYDKYLGGSNETS